MENALKFVNDPGLRLHPRYSKLPEGLLRLKHVALGGDGEPTESRQFLDIVRLVVHVRALRLFPFFKIALFTNGSNLNNPAVGSALRLFTLEDEIWVKLDAGTQRDMNRVNRTTIPLETILANILKLAKERPVIIRSTFSTIGGNKPTDEEVKEYAERLKEFREAGANISFVQIASAARSSSSKEANYLPLKEISNIASTVRKVAGVRVEVL